MLESLNALDENLVLQALQDKDPNVQSAGAAPGGAIPREIEKDPDRGRKLPKDEPAEVQFQRALTLGTASMTADANPGRDRRARIRTTAGSAWLC